jgi:hypothetical protein
LNFFVKFAWILLDEVDNLDLGLGLLKGIPAPFYDPRLILGFLNPFSFFGALSMLTRLILCPNIGMLS